LLALRGLHWRVTPPSSTGSGAHLARAEFNVVDPSADVAPPPGLGAGGQPDGEILEMVGNGNPVR
jgi:hypothetical protein